MNQNSLLVGIVSGALCLAIGFGSGALLTRPNRDKTNSAIKVQVEESQKKAQEEIRAAKNETKHLQRELKSTTDKLKQTEDDFKRVVAELEDIKNKVAARGIMMPDFESEPIPQKAVPPKTSEKINELTTPIFGIRLGESLSSLKRRLTITASSYSFEDEDHPGEIWDVKPSNSSVEAYG